MLLGHDDIPSWTPAVEGLARRVIGSAAESVRFTRLDDADQRSYEYEASRGDLTVAATDGISASVGLHRYLREQCGRSVGWDTALPLTLGTLPDCPPTTGTARADQGYYFNFCTFSYTMAYWHWPDWEREIDWMALHGITTPLAVTGHEMALHAAYSRLGMSDSAIREFLGGPGYLPFQFMGCLDGFAGPLPSSWLTSHRELGARIVRREREFGMTPVLPAFTGNVPREIAPSQTTRREWQGFNSWFLDPADPLYAQIGTEITQAQIELFGTDHLYAADPFIEMIPVDDDPAFPGRVAGATLAGLRAADPDAVWLMQAWPFSYQRDFWTDERVAAFLDSIPDDQLLVADLWAEVEPQWHRLDQFAGKSWLWCALLNFGGRTDPIANLRPIPTAIDAAFAAPNPPSGLGLAMEATRNNPVFFELVADQIWYKIPDVDAWLEAFVTQRYGASPQSTTLLVEAWRGLLRSIYDAQGVRISPSQFSGVLTKKPSYREIPDRLSELRADVDGALWYQPGTLVDAWGRMIDVAESERDLAVAPLGHDLIEISIAYLARIADRYFLDLVERSVQAGHASSQHVTRFLQIFDDLERVLATRREFTFQHWESKALGWAAGPDDEAVLLDNARRIITVWGTSTSPLLDDYAGRHWAGLIGGYYRDRWELWATGLDHALSSGGAAGETDLERRLRDRAEAFLRDGPAPAPHDLGDLITESRRLHTAYAGEAASLAWTRTDEEDRELTDSAD